MANKYLDLAGLQRLVNKIKELIPTRTSELDNDSGFITSAQAPVQSVNSKTGAVTLSKSDVGLGSVDNKSSATIRSEITSDNVTGALGYTPVNKAGDSITGDLKVNGDIVAGKELVIGYNGTTESLQRHKWKYNGSTGYLELWRYSNQNKWELSATFPNRNTGEGGLVVEGKQMATEDYVNNKVKTDVPANAKFTDTVTTINGKTGAITKADIVALGIPAQDTTYSIATTSANGLMSSTDKQNLEANTTSRHIHSNKSVIDKFTEVDNKLFYNGEEIGSGGAIVDLGAFNNEYQLIGHVIMNQLPTGHYTFIMDAPCFMLLERGHNRYYGTFHDTVASFYYFEVSFYGDVQELKKIDLRTLMTDVQM